MTNVTTLTALAIEPNEKLTHPYNLLPSHYHITRVSTIAEAEKCIATKIPSIILLNASFSKMEVLSFLEIVQKQLYSSIPKLIFVVDFNNRLNFIPGTNWGETADVISTRTNPKILNAIFTQ
jgi:DNA-binding response OmpR family regulator